MGPAREWYWISSKGATFGLSAEAGIVVEVAPIAEWARGKDLAVVLAHFRQQGRKVVALTAEQQQEVDDLDRTRASLDMHTMTGRGKRVVNRTTIFEMRKHKFIEEFVASKRVDDYPCLDEDLADENRHLLADYQGQTLRTLLVTEVRRCFERYAGPSGIDPAGVAHELLRSEHGGELHVVRDLPIHVLEIDLLLAHVEALGFDLSPRLAVSIARRAFLLLLNRRHFLPDVRPQQHSQAASQ